MMGTQPFPVASPFVFRPRKRRFRQAVAKLPRVPGFATVESLSSALFGCSARRGRASVSLRFTSSWGTDRGRRLNPRCQRIPGHLPENMRIPFADKMLAGRHRRPCQKGHMPHLLWHPWSFMSLSRPGVCLLLPLRRAGRLLCAGRVWRAGKDPGCRQGPG